MCDVVVKGSRSLSHLLMSSCLSHHQQARVISESSLRRPQTDWRAN